MVDATHCAIGNPGYFRHAVDWQHPTLDAGSCANTGGCMDRRLRRVYFRVEEEEVRA